MAPELRNHVNGYVLTGYVKGHPRLPDGPLTTSRLIFIDIKKKVAKTRNTTYALGDPDPEFIAWLESKGHSLDELVGQVV
jgi:hypothetical protein